LLPPETLKVCESKNFKEDMMTASKGFYIRQYVPNSHISGNSVHDKLIGAEVLGYVAGGTINSIQIKLTDGRVFTMHGYFEELK